MDKIIEKLVSSEIDIALRNRAKRILSELNLNKGDIVLDAGCGPGYYISLIDSIGTLGIKITGLEIDEKTFNYTVTRFKGKRNIKIIRADLNRLPFRNNTFNKVILSEVLEHVGTPKNALSEIYRVLKPSGFLVLTVPNKNYPLFWDPVNWFLERIFNKHVISGLFAGIWSGHLRLYDKDNLLILLKGLGYCVLISEPLTRFCLPFNKNLLYGGKLPKPLSLAFIKAVGLKQKPLLIRLALHSVAFLQRINEGVVSDRVGTNIFVKASKSER